MCTRFFKLQIEYTSKKKKKNFKQRHKYVRHMEYLFLISEDLFLSSSYQLYLITKDEIL